MSFFNSLKKSLGFDEETDDELLNDSIDRTSDETLLTDTADSTTDEDFATIETDPAMMSAIFNTVVRTFNAALPDFLKNAIDPELQKKQLYDSLDNSVKEYLNDVTVRTRRLCEQRWAGEQSSIRGEMENLKAKAKEIEQQRIDIKERQLSADRQRRALTDRVHDLESQLASIQAEREQLDLENKSLVNKVKVASVYETEAENLRNELNDARAQILAMRNENLSGEPAAGTSSNEKVAQFEATIADLNKQLAEAAEKDRISTEMMNGLQSKASSARSELEKKIAEIEGLKSRLAEAEDMQNDIEKITEQMALVESAIEKRDQRISKLKELCESLRKENAELNDTIAQNLKSHADVEQQLRDKIEQLEADQSKQHVSEPESADDFIVETPKISDGDLAIIEESFDNADWMSSEPAETPSMRKGIPDTEFGYQAPAKKTPTPDNDAQLSLF